MKESNSKLNLTPWQVTGLVDGEGAFTVSKSGHTIKLELKVTQKVNSDGILYGLTSFFKCGSVVIDNRKTDTKKFRVSALKDILTIIIPHFEKYPCLTSKFLNYQDWKKIAIKISKKEHLTSKGLTEINLIMENMNKKRSFEDKFNHCKNYFSFLSSPQRGQMSEGRFFSQKPNELMFKLSPEWVQAFISGEGTFYNYLAKSKSISKGKTYTFQRCDSSLEIGQNSHDVWVLLAIKNFFGGGYIKPKYNYNDVMECKNSRSLNRFVFRDTAAIIKFVDEHPMLTRKQIDYLNWKKVVELKNAGAHKTVEGLTLIEKIIYDSRLALHAKSPTQMK